MPIVCRARTLLLIHELYNDLLERAGRALEPLHLDVRSYLALAVLADDQPESQQQLGRAIRKGPAAIVHLVDQLALDGYVTRTPKQGDRRRRVVRLTSSGQHALAAADRLVQRIETEIFSDHGTDVCAVLPSLPRSVGAPSAATQVAATRARFGR